MKCKRASHLEDFDTIVRNTTIAIGIIVFIPI